MKHAGGRPKGSSNYSAELPSKLRSYIDDCLGKRQIPWIEEFIYRNRLKRRSFYNWLKDEVDFADAKDELMTVQEMMLKQMGISGKASASMCIFLLKANHNYIETERVQHEGKEGEPLSIIFTDVATWRNMKANRKLDEKLDNETVPIPEVQPSESSGGIGGYDSTNHSTRMNDLLTG